MGIQVQNITVKKKGKAILDNANFFADNGKITAITGPNGAGKTTLLKILAGNRIAGESANNTVLFNNKAQKSQTKKELCKKRAILSQATHITANFTAREVVLMGRYPNFKNLPSPTDIKYVDEVMRFTQTQNLTNRNVQHLSGGEMQRIQIARTLAQLMPFYSAEEPKVWMMDEPLNNLDVSHQHMLFKLARRFADAGNAVVIVLHDINMASRYADSVAIMHRGKTCIQGSPKQVFTSETLSHCYGIKASVVQHEGFKNPMVYFGDVYEQNQQKESIKQQFAKHF